MFFKEIKQTVSVTSDRYINIINECFLPTLSEVGVIPAGLFFGRNFQDTSSPWGAICIGQYGPLIYHHVVIFWNI